MKTLKNMEALFTVAVALACSASYVSFLQPQAASAGNTSVAVVSNSIPVVTISAKRMTPQEKKISLMEEDRQTTLRTL